MTTLRVIASLVFGIAAAVFLLLAISLPFQLRSQAAKDRIYYREFQHAAAIYAHDISEKGDNPLPFAGGNGIGPLLRLENGDCDGGFRKEPGDLFVLGFWRGEWTECFAYPSGRTTLPMSVWSYLGSGLGVDWGIYFLLAAGLGWAAWRIMPTRFTITGPGVRAWVRK
jgi:hypothetical protein